MRFIKMQGIGNDFVLIDTFQNPLDESQFSALSKRLCDRRFGVGSDGLLLVLPSNNADFCMRMFNPDGSEAEMCGNGIRCFAKYLYDHHLTTQTEITVETLGGIKPLQLFTLNGLVQSVRVGMGVPCFAPEEIPVLLERENGSMGEKAASHFDTFLPPARPPSMRFQTADCRNFEMTCVNVGNPHGVIFLEDIETLPVAVYGPLIENHPLFPQRINVQFAQVLSPGEIRLRTWERGAGATLACGTGACATAVAAAATGRAERSVLIHLPGGDLQIEWQEDEQIYMTGPAEEVFEGGIREVVRWEE